MSRNPKIAITLPVTFTVFSVLLILFLPHANAVLQIPSGPQCESTYTVIYTEPAKFNETNTINILKQNLANIDFNADVLDGHPWWDYMHISKPDENNTSSLTIPTVSGVVDDIVRKTMQDVDGVLKVDDVMMTWCN
ncbi:MAG: hypothetical protein ACREBB_08450 [Nitrosotalea sp.]